MKLGWTFKTLKKKQFEANIFFLRFLFSLIVCKYLQTIKTSLYKSKTLDTIKNKKTWKYSSFGRGILAHCRARGPLSKGPKVFFCWCTNKKFVYKKNYRGQKKICLPYFFNCRGTGICWDGTDSTSMAYNKYILILNILEQNS